MTSDDPAGVSRTETLLGTHVRLRPGAGSDAAELVRIRSTPEVLARWRGGDLEAEVVDDLASDDAHGHHRLTIDPAADNEPAIRCYAKVGFQPVGIMRQYERAPDGTWHDGLLMELLADDLTD